MRKDVRRTSKLSMSTKQITAKNRAQGFFGPEGINFRWPALAQTAEL